jgi:protein O-GlcNAc transferase
VSRNPAIQQAIAQFEAGQSEQAKQTLRALLRRAPDDAQVNKYLAMLHGALHEDEQAWLFISRAARSAPDDPEIQFMLGNVATITRRYREGARAYAATVRLNPDNLHAYDGQAKCLVSLGDYAQAMEVYERGLARAPDNPDLYFRMGVTLALIGRVEEALAAARRGLERNPDEPSLAEFLAYYRNFADGVDPVAHRLEHERAAALLARDAPTGETSFPNDPDPERPLRVGFVSPDFFFHACAFFLEGPLRAMDRARVEPYLYAFPTKRDAFTKRFEALGQWRDVTGLTPEEIGQRVRADRIDVLVDLAAWTDRRNIRVFATRWAPVQATYLGYPNTTGLRTVDARIVDWLTDPAGSESHCTERLIRLDRCFLCFSPPEGAHAPFDPVPASRARAGAPVTFGSFNRVMKVGPAAVRTWAAILHAVPGSRLLVKAQIAAEEVGAAYAARFASHGIDPARIVTAPWTKRPGEHYGNYRLMDIALDSFPYAGTTTTCEALWMGVPVVTLAGGTHRARVGVSLLDSVGVPELVARDHDDYVRIAVELARDPARLAGYHRTLRERCARSTLWDAPGFARSFERALRDLWRAWCARQEGRR